MGEDVTVKPTLTQGVIKTVPLKGGELFFLNKVLTNTLLETLPVSVKVGKNNIEEFFLDFDKLRKGRVTKSQFE